MSKPRVLSAAECVRDGVNVHVECCCGRIVILDAASLKRLCMVRRWDDGFEALLRRLKCRRCGKRPAALYPRRQAAEVRCGPADEDGWKRLVRRLRD